MAMIILLKSNCTQQNNFFGHIRHIESVAKKLTGCFDSDSDCTQFYQAQWMSGIKGLEKNLSANGKEKYKLLGCLPAKDFLFILFVFLFLIL